MGQKGRDGRVSVDGIELDYKVRGNGEYVVLVHAGHLCRLVQTSPEAIDTTKRYRVVCYPGGMAERLVAFFARHRIKAAIKN